MHTIIYRPTYTLLGFLLLAASCSQDELPPGSNGAEGGRIEFRASLPEVSSRATEVTGASLDKFQVSSFIVGSSSLSTYFLDKTFSQSAAGKFASLDPECIWPNGNAVLRFFAFAPSCEEMRAAGGFGNADFSLLTPAAGEVIDSDEYEMTDFRVAKDIASQFDFITATASGRLLDYEDEGLDLNFQHQLSRIQLKAWSASSTYDMEIAGVRLGGVGTSGTFNFAAEQDATGPAKAGRWATVDKGCVEYVFSSGDVIVALDKSAGAPVSAGQAVSILGNRIGGEDGYENSAMLIPALNTAWQYIDNPANGINHADGMYFSVLVRVIDTTPQDHGDIVYPYPGDSQGMEVVYLAVDQATKKNVIARLYKDGEDYFTDPDMTSRFDLEENSAEAKAFGWAALPVGDEWKPGYVYTYTLNYSDGVGLRDPHDPNPGEPIIRERVLVTVDVAEWKTGTMTDVSVPRK
ncbi:MAG: fimbrillin family protein [Muribaculaceae bacterium]|nr:fimbrillin family protein [Muribaculaceae bacterium]